MRLLVLFLALMASFSHAEVLYDAVKPGHVADKNCIAAISILRDILYDEVEIEGSKVWIKRVMPTADVVKARKSATQRQNQFDLKYAYSRELNAQVKAQKQAYQKNLVSGGTSYVETLIECM